MFESDPPLTLQHTLFKDTLTKSQHPETHAQGQIQQVMNK